MRRLLCVLSLLVLGATAAHAQSSTSTLAPVDPAVADPNQVRERDPNFSSSGGGLNMMNLIHNANLGPTRSIDEFKRDRDRKLDETISNFRRTELRLTPKLLESSPGTPTTPAAATQVNPATVPAGQP